MKQTLLSLLVALCCTATLSAQDLPDRDWANFGRYASANATVTSAPKAVLMGDSITDGWYRNDEAFFHDNNFVGRGISGQVSAQMLVRFRRDVIDLHPKYVVILAGINDIARNDGYIALENTFANIVSMCELARANKIKPVLCPLVPSDRVAWRPAITDTREQVERLNTMIKDYALICSSTAEIFTTVNARLSENNREGMFATAWIGILDTRTGCLQYTNAGHNYPVLQRSKEPCILLKKKHGLFLAGMDDTEYSSGELQMEPGDRLLLYTDGITEAHDRSGAFYGTERLLAAMEAAGEDNTALLDAVIRDVNDFASGAPQFDDITMLAISIKPKEE